MNPYFLKRIDSWAGRLLTFLLPAPRKQKKITKIYSVLFIRPGGIGDAVLLAPAINLLQKKFSGTSVDVLAEKRNAGVFQLIPEIRYTYLYDTPSDLIRVLHAGYDVVIDTEQWHRLSAVVARMTGAPVIIGFDTNDRIKLLTHSVTYSHDDYEVSSFFKLLEPLGIHSEKHLEGSFLTLPSASLVESEVLTRGMAGAAYVTIFPGASIKERQWGADNFSEVASKLESVGLNVVIVGGKEDIAQGDRILSSAKGINLAGKTTISVTAALIAGSKFLLSGDSGVLHLAVGLGIPTVSLFGPGIALKWAPKGEQHEVLTRSLQCSPCTRFGYTPSCGNNVACLSGISPDDVVNAIMMQLSKS